MIELEEITRIKWNIIGLSEVRRKGKRSIILNNTGHTIYCSGSDEQRHRVGFMVNKNIARNVISFRGLSDRLVELTIRIKKRYQLKCVQVYLPTTSYPDEGIEKVYEKVDKIIINSKALYNIVMGDFNAKVGPGEIRETCTGSYGIGTRNRRGDMLVEFAERHKFKIMSTFFKKRLNRRWTWISPNGLTKNEIDYIMTNSPDIFLDVSVISSLNTGSDHRMMRGKARINTKFERAKVVAQPKKVDTGKLQHYRREFQVEIQNRFGALASIPPDDLDSRGDTTAKMIHEAAISIAGRYKSEKRDNLSTSTKQLREKRRQMKRNGTPTDNIECSDICKAIRRKMKETSVNTTRNRLSKP